MPNRRASRHTRPTSGLDLERRGVRVGLGVVVALVITGGLAATRTAGGSAFLAEAQSFLTFYAGVFSLVGLTTTVALGLAATDRVILPIAQRVRVQLVHRAMALLGIGFLIVHIGMKIAAGLVPPYGSVVPSTNVYVSMGVVASDLFIVIIATGVMRGRFAQAERPWLWRGLHDLAYLAWPVAILHGLTAGRAAAPWVTFSYVACLAAVGAALLIRLAAATRPARQAATGDWAAAPAAVPATAPHAAFSTARRTTREDENQRTARPVRPQARPEVAVLARTGTDPATPDVPRYILRDVLGDAPSDALSDAPPTPQEPRLRRIV
ncbi:hypothetical protein [Microbispora amethystogenes]|uniref:Ferric oxidoreductase domain-containing protein n=1 Tax=Microbispora amethystogenes TaxID=1427754 RepID=A0ABQ4FJ37_9ACTN|nr:hypothetical protein [Microbispora amethystogenes]GIH34828.1 hypothetical protein Mam01_49920 [Microbispora amethystogenes]